MNENLDNQMTDGFEKDSASPPSAGDTHNIPDMSAIIDIVSKIAPQLMETFKSNGTDGILSSLIGKSDVSSPKSITGSIGASRSKTQLLKALKPYMNTNRAAQIDRAVEMIETAYTAKSALSLLGAAGKGDKNV